MMEIRSWLVLLLVFQACTVFRNASAVILLSPTAVASAVWSGRCDDLSCANSLCSLPPTGVSSTSLACEMYFESGDYLGSSHDLVINSTSEIALHFSGTVSNLILNITSDLSASQVCPIRMYGGADSGGARTRLVDSSFTFRSTNGMLTGETTELTFETSSSLRTFLMQPRAYVYWEFQHTDFSYDVAHTLPIIQYDASIGMVFNSLVFTNSSASYSMNMSPNPTTHSPFWQATVPAKIIMTDAMFGGSYLANIAPKPTSRAFELVLTNASLSLYGNASTFFTTAVAPLFTLTMQNSTIIGQSAYPVSFSNCQFASIGVFTALFQNVNLGDILADFNFNQTNFIDTRVRLLSSPSSFLTQIIEATVSIKDEYSYFYINRSQNTVGMIANLTVYVDPSQAHRMPFVIKGRSAMTLHPASYIDTNYLWLQDTTNISIDTLTVTQYIGNTNPNQKAGLKPTLKATWTFHSIVIENVDVDINGLDPLYYFASNPSTGITVQSGASGTLMVPKRILVSSGTDDSKPVKMGVWYPYVSEVSSHVPCSILGDFKEEAETRLAPISPDTQSSLLNRYEFRFLPANLTLPPSSLPCPTTIPPGFVCVDGVLVAFGNVNTTTISLPPGIVVIIGNLTVDTITIQGTSTVIQVRGCIKAPSIHIELEGLNDPTQSLPSGPVTIIQQDADCSNSIFDTIIEITQNGNSCKQVTVTKDPNSSSTSALSVIFGVDDTKCNSSSTWRWIVLGTVLGVVAVTALVLFLLWRSFHNKKKPL